jgi:hypothetical protein
MSGVISTRNPNPLPAVVELRRLCQSLAMLDAVLMPEWDNRYYSFDAHWGDGEMLASMRNGSGDTYAILFTAAGAIIKGYAHESEMGRYAAESGRPWPGVVEQVPPEFQPMLAEPAFPLEETSFCVWRKADAALWEVGAIRFPEGEDPDGSRLLLSVLDGNPRTYQEWSEEYYERSVPLDAVEAVYQHQPLDGHLLGQLNPDITVDELSDDGQEIGYPDRVV